MPVRRPGLAHRRGADARLHERRGARAHARDRRAAPLEPLARASCGTRARRRGNTQTRARAAPRLRRRRAARARRAGRPRLPHRRAHLLPQAASSSRPRRTRRCRRSSARSPRAPRERPEGSYTVELLDDPPRIGAKVEEEAEEVARAAREETDERVDEEAADVLYHLTVLLHSARPRARRRRARCSMAVAADAPPALPRRRPSLDEVRELAREHNLVPLRHSFIDDCETPVSRVPEAARARPGSPAFLLESAEQGQRVGRCQLHRLPPARGRCAGRSATAATPTRSPPPRSARYRQAPLPDLPPFAGGAVGFFGYDLVRTVEPLGEPNPDAVGLPDMALMLTDVLVVFDHLKHTITILVERLRRRRRRRRAPTPTRVRDDRRRCARLLAGPVPARRADARRARRPTFESNMPREQFEAMVARIVEYVHAGDAFQVVPSQRWSAPMPTSSRSRSTAACARSTRARTCTSWTSATSRSPAPAPSRC